MVAVAARAMISIIYIMLRDNAPYRGQIVEMTTRKLKRVKYRASVGLQTLLGTALALCGRTFSIGVY